MKFQPQFLRLVGLVAIAPLVMSAPVAQPDESNLKRTLENLYEPLDYVYEDKRLNVKEKKREAENLYEPLDYVYEDKRLNVKDKKREAENLYEPLDYVYEGKRLNVKREVESRE